MTENKAIHEVLKKWNNFRQNYIQFVKLAREKGTNRVHQGAVSKAQWMDNTRRAADMFWQQSKIENKLTKGFLTTDHLVRKLKIVKICEFSGQFL